MPRPPRLIFADQCYHVLNRANRRAEIFHDRADYAAFVALMARAQERMKLPLLAACLMPNHVHLVVRPEANDDIARWMQWLFTTHVRHYHEKYGTSGRVWQGRYKSFLIQDDHYLLTVMRYVERNAQRAKLVARAEALAMGKLALALDRRSRRLRSRRRRSSCRPGGRDLVNQPQTAAETRMRFAPA